MAVCPYCGARAFKPVRIWELGRVKIGLFRCPRCRRYFRAKVA